MIERNEFLRQEYQARINRVISYIENNLDSQLSLRELSEIANFSPYHFHRIFKGMIGEPLNEFIRRIRLSQAASWLEANPRKTITEIALDSGFGSSASFARAFKSHFGMSASEYRKGGFLEIRRINRESRFQYQNSNFGQQDSKISKHLSKNWKDSSSNLDYIDNELISEDKSKEIKFNAEVKILPEISVVYMLHLGEYYKMGTVYEKLFKWAFARGLFNSGHDVKSLAVYHDNPDVTDVKKLRTSCCLTAPKDFPIDGEVCRMIIPSGKYVVAHCEINMDQFGIAWDTLMGEWMPQSGYQPADGICYELYHNTPDKHPEGKFVLDLCEPIKPL